MSVTPAYREFILEQLGRLLPITPRNMFGAIGFYSEGAFFAVVDDDTLYFKVDDSTRPAYEALGSEPFRPSSDDPPSKGYYTVPGDVLEDPDELRRWAIAAVGVARSKGKKKAVKATPKKAAKKSGKKASKASPRKRQ